MAEVKNTFNPSVNITRDLEKDFHYVVTPNAKQIYSQLVKSLDSGVHSFTIIGSYGTGKSSFLVALRKNLIRDTYYFEPLNGEFSNIDGFEFDYFVGKYSSLIDEFRFHFDLDEKADENEILKRIDEKHEQLRKAGKFWFIAIDEFGKHLEHAASENPERELYFIQLLSEYVNEKEKNLFFITTLHQAFDSYAHGLDAQQRMEWDKVRGRLKELTFNEPVEQLLHIASEFLKGETLVKSREGDISKLLKIIELSKAFPLKNELSLELGKNLFPLEPLAASILSLALQKYGQNERSLFTFLQSDEYLGIKNYDRESNPFYNISCVYDYLIQNHHSYLSSKYNPHYVQWNALKKSIERVESVFEDQVTALKNVVKTIGLLNIFANDGAKIDKKFLAKYCELTHSEKKVNDLLSSLEKKQVIRYRSFKNQYILFEGTDFDIEHELHQATSKLDPVKDVVTSLKKYFHFPYLPAKRVYYEKGTPRFFEFVLSEKLHKKSPKQPIDGYVNLVFNSPIDVVKKESANLESPILYGVFTNTSEIENQLFLIERTKYLLGEIDSDKVAERELRELLASQIEELNTLVLENVYSHGQGLKWVYRGKELSINGSKSLNNELSNIIDDVYFKTPFFENELINKEKVSPAIYKPRKNLLQRLIENRYVEDLGFLPNEFPAEKTIYLSLLKNSGIHKIRDGQWELGEPDGSSGLGQLWESCESFFESTKSGKKSLTDLIALLNNAPLGLKSGFIELWIPIYLIIKDNDYALFQEEAYIPELTYDVVNLIYRNPKLFEVKAYHISDVKKQIFSNYRAYHNQDENADFSNHSFVETIRPFLLVYNSLNEYGRGTNKISQSAQKLRDAIKTATEPEKAFFEDFPLALGYSNLESLESEVTLKQFVFDLDKSIEEIKNSYSQLIDRIEHCVVETLRFSKDLHLNALQEELKIRYGSIKGYKLAPYQTKLLGRLLSSLSDREKWISSLAFAVLDKPLSKMNDNEEPMLLEKLSTRLEELDNLRELTSQNVDPEKEEIFRMRLQPFGKQAKDINVVVGKIQIKEESKRLDQIRDLLTTDKKMNVALLVKIIQELEHNE